MIPIGNFGGINVAFESNKITFNHWTLVKKASGSILMNLKIVTNLLLAICPCFCDLIGQNRLGNNRMVMNFNKKQPHFRSRSYMMALLTEMAKTTAGRNAVKNFMTKIPNRRAKNSRGRVRRF